MSLRLTASRLTSNPLVRRSLLASSTTANAGVFAWTRPHRPHRRALHQQPWSETPSFASPESDFSAAPHRRTLQTTATTDSVHHQPQNDDAWSETLSFASPESDFATALENCTHAHPRRPLPLTWAAALHEQQAAVVITTAKAPHKVVAVNAAWETLCGYTQEEALYRPIGPLLQQDTPQSHTHQAARHLMDQLQADHFTLEHDAYLENFTKSGRSFLNHVRVGPLYWDEEPAIHHDEPEFLVAILEEVQRDQVPLRMVV